VAREQCGRADHPQALKRLTGCRSARAWCTSRRTVEQRPHQLLVLTGSLMLATRGSVARRTRPLPARCASRDLPIRPPAPRRRANRSRRAACSGWRCRAGRARVVAGARQRRPCLVSRHRVFGERLPREALVVAELDPHRFMTPSIIATSTYWPLPVMLAWRSAASSPIARCRPVPESPICAPVTKGGPSGRPWCSSPRPSPGRRSRRP